MVSTGIPAPALGYTSSKPEPGQSSSCAIVRATPRQAAQHAAWLVRAQESYRRESGDPSPIGYNVNSVVGHLARGQHEAALWLLFAPGQQDPLGYAVTTIAVSHARRGFIAEAWIDPLARGLGFPGTFFAMVEEWARALRATGLSFETWRSSKAYARLLRGLGYKSYGGFVKDF